MLTFRFGPANSRAVEPLTAERQKGPLYGEEYRE